MSHNIIRNWVTGCSALSQLTNRKYGLVFTNIRKTKEQPRKKHSPESFYKGRRISYHFRQNPIFSKITEVKISALVFL